MCATGVVVGLLVAGKGGGGTKTWMDPPAAYAPFLVRWPPQVHPTHWSEASFEPVQHHAAERQPSSPGLWCRFHSEAWDALQTRTCREGRHEDRSRRQLHTTGQESVVLAVLVQV